MSWPTTFGNLSSPVAASLLDGMFNQVAAGMEIPCSAIGTNLISLTPLANFPALTNYNELGGYRFRAATSSTGLVTAQYNGLSILPVYHADGVTQASTGDVVANFEYVLRFSQALNGGLGGFFLESPALPNAPATWFTPGGRLSNVVNTPVAFTSQGNSSVFYAPYIHPFCPVFNGTSMQMVQFTSSLSDPTGLQLNMSGSPATWPQNTAFDVFLTLVVGVPTLCTISWTNLTTRAVNLAVWGGVLTNNSSNTAQTSSGAITLAVHQGTYLGSFMTHPSINGNTQWIFGSSATGGGLSLLQICNYYNKVLFTTRVTDAGGSYTYTASTVRNANGSANNAIQLFTGDSERSQKFIYTTRNSTVANASAGGITGLGVDTTTSFAAFFQDSNSGATSAIYHHVTILPTSTFGFHTINALEQGDNVNANSFNLSNNALIGQLWL